MIQYILRIMYHCNKTARYVPITSATIVVHDNDKLLLQRGMTIIHIHTSAAIPIIQVIQNLEQHGKTK